MRFQITQYLIAIVLTLYICACVNAKKPNEAKVKAGAVDTIFIPDRFEFRDDTASFIIDKAKISGEILTLDLSFMAISCTCAQWTETKYLSVPDKRIAFFLEPANSSLVNADTLFDGNHLPVRISAKGQFYLREGYPKNYRPSKGSPKPAKVFRYTEIKIISLGSGVNAKP